MAGSAGSSQSQSSSAQQTTAQRPLKTEAEFDEPEANVTTPPFPPIDLHIRTTNLHEGVGHQRAFNHGSQDSPKSQRSINDFFAGPRRAHDRSDAPRPAAAAHEEVRRQTPPFFPPSPSSSAISACVHELDSNSEDGCRAASRAASRIPAARASSSGTAVADKDLTRKVDFTGPCDRCKARHLECVTSSLKKWTCNKCPHDHAGCTRNGLRVAGAQGSRHPSKGIKATPAVFTDSRMANTTPAASSKRSQDPRAPSSPFRLFNTSLLMTTSTGKSRFERFRQPSSGTEDDNSDAHPSGSDSSDGIQVVSRQKRKKTAPTAQSTDESQAPDSSASVPFMSRSRPNADPRPAFKQPFDIHTANLLKDTTSTLRRVKDSLTEASSLAAFGPTLTLLMDEFRSIPGFSTKAETSRQPLLTEIYQLLSRLEKDCVTSPVSFVAQSDAAQEKGRAWLAQALVDRCLSRVSTLLSETDSEKD